MHTTASGVFANVNTVIGNPLFAGLIVAAVVGVVSLVWRSVFQQWRRFGWKLLYDEPINQALTPSETGQRDGGTPYVTPTPWEIQYQEAGLNAPQHKVRNGSLVAMELKNIGRLTIRESDFDDRQFFRIRFPGRKVVHYKVRDNPWYHDKVHKGTLAPPVPGADNFLNLPALQIVPGQGFKLLVLLEAETGSQRRGQDTPEFEGSIQHGKFVEFGHHRRGVRYGIAALAVLILALGSFFGAQITENAQQLAPVCGKGNLAIAGSTAFAPVLNQVATEYEQHCSEAHISINADGSASGLQDLENRGADIAMFDGAPDPTPDAQYRPVAVGAVIFAVVGNDSQKSMDTYYFRQGLQPSNIKDLYTDPSAYKRILVGRKSASGTRATFVKEFLGGNDSAENSAPPCPAASGVCLEPTTMQLLAYVNDTPNSLGYAEADALPFFPNVAQIAVGGYWPTRGNVLNGHYSFLAREHLYTNGEPSGLTSDFIGFLTSAPVTKQLRATTSFIACADLVAHNQGGDCPRN